MTYDFASLSHADFEDLSRDLVGEYLAVRFEAFSAGPDQGMDGRHAKGPEKIILQAKHLAGSKFADLKRTMKKERAAIDRLAPSRYVLTTSCKLTPANKAELAEIIGPSLKSEDDILGPGDLNGLLRRYPEITKSHIKLWLTGTAVLERVLNAASHSFNDITRDEIADKLRVYAPNASFNHAREKLEKEHVVIISGPPGVGKTTLAEMIGYAYLAEDWNLVAIRSLNDGLSAISDSRKQIFYFDDFLGRVALDKRALAQMDSDLARFIKRVRKSKNARFVLTTRAPIFEEAKRHSEHLADHQLDISKYLLDVTIYTRRIKARILYNHLLVTGTPQPHIDALIDSGKIARIVDHRNYSPRLIALMTEGSRVSELEPSAYPNAFIAALDKPTELWDIPFRNHIPRTCQHLLMTIFFSGEFWVPIERLRVAYEAYHASLNAHYGWSHDPKDFEESLKILEGGFVKITGKSATFVNPSVRDYLLGYLDDYILLKLAAKSARRADWMQSVWDHAKRLGDQWKIPAPAERVQLAESFVPAAHIFLTQPTKIQVTSEHGVSYHSDGPSNVERLELLIDWWQVTNNDQFLNTLQTLVANPVGGWDIWRDGDELIALVGKLRDRDYFGEFPLAGDLADTLEAAAVDLIESHSLNSEELTKLSDAYEDWSRQLSPEIKTALDVAIKREFAELDDVLRSLDSESMVDEHIDMLEKLASRADVPQRTVDKAKEAADERKYEIDNASSYYRSPSIRSAEAPAGDNFDDVALNNLFAPLRVGQE